MQAITYWHEYIDHVYACTDKASLQPGQTSNCTMLRDCDEAKRLKDEFLKAEKRELITR